MSQARMQRKIWEIRPRSAHSKSLAGQLKITPLFAQILLNRQISDPKTARSFLSPKLTDLIDPARLPGMQEAVERIRRAVKNKEQIAIYGDYDVDGISSVAILWHLFRMLGLKADYYIPHRVDEGYGLNPEAVHQLAEAGTNLLITVDCGIGAVEEIALARRLGMDVIITDHHRPCPQLPDASAVVHPLLDTDYPNPSAAGAMVAFKLAWALAESFRNGGKTPPDLRQYLLNATTLAGLGTIADVVELRGENRVIAGYGLKALEESSLCGIRALVEAAELAGRGLESYDIAFTLAPMLNAAGRMGHARLAVELLTTENAYRAAQIARYLKEQNKLRQKCQRDIFKQVRQRILEAGFNHPDRRTIVLAGENWHPGVIGIVASRVIEEFGKPAILINLENGLGQGSGRSIEGFNLHDALCACREHLVRFGGHELAAGLRIQSDRVAAFAQAFEDYARRCNSDSGTPAALSIDAEASIREFSEQLMRELAWLEPFGQGNPPPLFATRGVRLIAPPRRCGAKNDHLQISIQDNTGAVRCIGFGMGPLEKKLLEADCFHVAYKPQYNTWNGSTNLQFVLEDIQFD
ncbi:MAG TPA: single-stranded-DNA-specific exonuclease RecJ [Anaerohalosphaeraceae bacterium]|nr:single-stranded-DNA-specific exonuclease RecJ [Anaerohalosphaeraceae bacterium]HPB92194.1 single-stranded-DNA-specific exonuclease RecJ [Anaerohalosphaeraceae bacterium]HRT23914.1 single-stranded-DNA-specific exonuclease RecJ [Anaerohalosphaeraceae bacterium]